MSFSKEVWDTLSSIDCSNNIEKKMGLSYLSWAWAWAKLMDNYPESGYIFDSPSKQDDGTVEIWVTVSVKDGEKVQTRRMWLPVMDYKNNAIPNPTTRHISDTRMRCLTKCLAMFGLGHYIYAGEDLPNKKDDPDYERQQFIEDNKLIVSAIKDALSINNLAAAKQIWSQNSKDEKIKLWACFSNDEKEIMQSDNFRSIE